MSTNRVLENHNTNCKVSNFRNFRFSKYHSNINGASLKKITSAFAKLSLELSNAIEKVSLLKEVIGDNPQPM